jgi:hypothetical protein
MNLSAANSKSGLSGLKLSGIVWVGALCFFLLLALPVRAQNLGRISGIVSDSSGGVVAGATVTVTDVDRGITRNLTTDSSGTYSAPNLTPSNYTVRGSFMGFRPFQRQSVSVGPDQDVHVDMTLQPGEQTQTVTVTEEVPAVTTTNAQLTSTITSQTLADLPVSGHNWVRMLDLLPTFQVRQGSATGPVQYTNGLRSEYNMYVFDGVTDAMAYFVLGPITTGYTAGGPEQSILIPTDAIQEFNIIQNGKAEYGWRPGSQINVTTKSGANAMHGAAFAAGRSTGLTNRNAFATFKPPISFEDFDATVGGAIKKDKLFYLVGYEGQRGTVGNPKNVVVPSLAAGLGPASSIPDAIADLQSHVAGGGAPPNPVMLNIAGCVLGPPVSCTPNKGLFSNNTQSTSFPVDFLANHRTDNGLGKLDFHLNEHHVFSVELYDGDGFGVAPLNATQQYWSTPLETHSVVARAMWTWIPNSNWVNDLRFGYDAMPAFSNSGNYDCQAQPGPTGALTDNEWVNGSGAPNYASFGLVGGGSPSCAFPTMTISGLTGANANTLGGAGGTYTTSGIERWVDSVSWTHGSHITKFGGDFNLVHGTVALNVQNYKGTLNFNNTNAALNAFVGATPLDNFMAGIVSTASIQVGAASRNFSYKGVAVFVQDDWRIYPRLTINLGLRYENTSTIHEVNNLIGNVAFGTPTGVTQQGQGGPLYKLDPWAFAPRFGLAWDITGKGKTVLRTGFNIAYQNPTIQPLITPGTILVPTGINLVNGATVLNAGGTIDTQNLAAFALPSKAAATIVQGQPFFGGNVANLVGSCSTTVPCAIGGVISNLQMPMAMNWSFGIQHAITNSLTIDVNYAGTHGQHLFDFIDVNQPTSGANTSPAVENSRRPLASQYPWFSQIKLLGGTTNVSWYHGLQIMATQRASRGLSFIASYTWAHSLDTQSSDLSPVVPQDSRNPFADYGNSSYDLRHRFTFGPSYNIPGRQGYFQMLQGWQVTSTFKVFSGFPINPLDAADDLSGTGEGQDRWTIGGDPHGFNGFGNAQPIPCFYNAVGNASAFSKGGICTAGLPQACIDAANAEPNGPAGVANNTGIAELNRLGCYMKGGAVMVPPAGGTFGSAGRFPIYSLWSWEWNASIVKSFKINERFSTQFRADIYNVTNSTFFAAPAATLSSPSTFGASSATPDTNSPFVGTGGPRKIQIGLKISF